MKHQISEEVRVPLSASGQRLDQVAAQLFPDYSRAKLQEWIKSAHLLVDGRSVKTNAKLIGGESIRLDIELPDEGEWESEAMDLDVVFEDDDILVIDKPAGLVVHPAAGNYQGTLLNGLLHAYPSLRALPRAGIVHRLDKDTTGLMVIAKTLPAQTHLVEQMQARSVSRKYVAFVVGVCPAEGTVDAPIGRDPKDRKKMAVVRSGGKEAVTHYRRLGRFGPFSLLRLRLETGRTHQIRVHMAHIGFPLLGDPNYGKKLPKSLDISVELHERLQGFGRQALHAERLALTHPITGRSCEWHAPWPDDFQEIYEDLQRECGEI
jgi:23S rRNA pseudouridine1911/1915/1917 synthase